MLTSEPDYSLVKSESAVQDTLLVQFLQKMLQKDPERRATVQDLLTDKWLTRDMKNRLLIFDAIETEHSDYWSSSNSLEPVPETEKDFEVDLSSFPDRLINRFGLQLQDLIENFEDE